MKIIPEHIEIICPICESKAKYTPPKSFHIYEGDKKIALSKFNEELARKNDSYKVRLNFDNKNFYEIPYSKFIDKEMTMHNGPYAGNGGKLKMGWLSCLECGTTKIIKFEKRMYYYQVPFKKRTVYARTLKVLLQIRNQFDNDHHFFGDSDLDYPKVFWENRVELVNKIDKFLVSKGIKDSLK